MNVTKASLILEIDDKSYVAILKDIDLNLMVDVISTLLPENKLKVVPLNDTFKWEEIASTDFRSTV